MAETRPRFGLIGTGIWTRLVNAPAAHNSDAVRFSAVFGRNASTTGAIADAYGVTAYTDLDRFLREVDIVGIAVPPAAQPALALAAIAAGKPLLLEKPLALSTEAADDIAAAAERAGLPTLVFFTALFNRSVRAWVAEARATEGWLGAQVTSLGRILVDPTNPFYETAWRAEGGALWDGAPHSVAMLVAVLGRAEAVVATAGMGDFKVLTIRHVGGAVSSIHMAMDMPAPIAGGTVFYGKSGGVSPPKIDDWNAAAGLSYAEALRQLAQGDMTGSPDADFGAHVTRILAAAERSIATGRRIELDERSSS